MSARTDNVELLEALRLAGVTDARVLVTLSPL